MTPKSTNGDAGGENVYDAPCARKDGGSPTDEHDDIANRRGHVSAPGHRHTQPADYNFDLEKIG